MAQGLWISGLEPLYYVQATTPQMELTIQIREHEDLGIKGLVIVDNVREYFEPATHGSQFAHDILEHPVVPHENGYIDELLALGAVVVGRIDCGWRQPYGRPLDDRDIQGDFYSLFSSGLNNEDYFWEIKCPVDYSSHQLYDRISSQADTASIEVQEDFVEYNFSWDHIKNVTNWLIHGSIMFLERFDNDVESVMELFTTIMNLSEKFKMDHYLPGAIAKLHIDFSNFSVFLEDDWEYGDGF